MDKSFNNWRVMSDKAIAEHIGAFVRHHRLELIQSQHNLAEAAGISRSTLSLLERGEPVTLATFIQVLRVLDQLQVMEAFQVQKIISPIALAKEQKSKRIRARGKNKKKG